ncbi:phosphoribosyltransferase [Pontibacter silvestris]|uniref:Phosphoribosyltransferase n=1 Tax=Pontibacter silvestris TaxID=2305183 RepID=A0ABW4WW96_9BACT|nr:phosphoribosyltransferase [Pontibacter silvestris]MCC9138931.1 phosphoribosyltransferase [Pontibacter silvestris]
MGGILAVAFIMLIMLLLFYFAIKDSRGKHRATTERQRFKDWNANRDSKRAAVGKETREVKKNLEVERRKEYKKNAQHINHETPRATAVANPMREQVTPSYWKSGANNYVQEKGEEPLKEEKDKKTDIKRTPAKGNKPDVKKTTARGKEAKENAELKALYSFDIAKPVEDSEIHESLWAEYGKIFSSDPALDMQRGKDISWVELSSEFKNRNTKRGFAYYSLLDYYPKNRYREVPAEVENIRRLIYAFKDGYNSSEIALLVASALYGEFSSEYQDWSEANTVFSIIPASTESRNKCRFLSFCSLVSEYLGVKNGYSAIEVNFDKEALKGVVGVDKTENLLYNAPVFAGKNVILFDDVKTSGGSFVQNANKLIELGANNVTGVFLGETYDSYSRGEPYWTVQEETSYREVIRLNDEPDDLPF